MSDELSKTVIRIIQDYCFENSASLFCDRFSTSISPTVTRLIKSKNLNLCNFHDIIKERRDFFIANALDQAIFSKGLFQRLNYELAFYKPEEFYDIISTFKRKMENGNFRGFPKDKTSEDTLRCTLVIYLDNETFCEARSAAGYNDITVPSEKVVLETKLWKGMDYYNSGFPELNEYLDKYNYNEGYYIIFDYNQTPNDVIAKNGEIFDIKYCKRNIHVVFIKMNAERPSKIYKLNKPTNS